MKVTKVGTKESRIHGCGHSYLQRDSAEHEGYGGVHTDKRITENNITNADRQENRLLEEILKRDNLNKAYKQVKKNKGSYGIDGMKTDELLQYLKDNGKELIQSILDGEYLTIH